LRETGAAFDNFEISKVAAYKQGRINQLLKDSGLIRNRLKIEASARNAQSFLSVQEEFGSFDAYVWQFVGGSPKQNHWKSSKQVPARTAESDQLSKDLRRRGFNFVGSTICYAFMQAVGMVNDHNYSCFRFREIS